MHPLAKASGFIGGVCISFMCLDAEMSNLRFDRCSAELNKMSPVCFATGGDRTTAVEPERGMTHAMHASIL